MEVSKGYMSKSLKFKVLRFDYISPKCVLSMASKSLCHGALFENYESIPITKVVVHFFREWGTGANKEINK